MSRRDNPVRAERTAPGPRQFGAPLCEFMVGYPKDWPPGHKWVDMLDSGDATCTTCIQKAGKRRAPKGKRWTTCSECRGNQIDGDGDTCVCTKRGCYPGHMLVDAKLTYRT